MKIDTTTQAFPTLRKFRWNSFYLAEIPMVALLAIFTGLPVLFILLGSFNLAPPGREAVYGFDNWVRAFTDTGTLNALWMSVLISVTRNVPEIIIAVLLAWFIARTDMPGGKVLEFICWLAYFAPDFPQVLAWILLLDPHFGFLNTFARDFLGFSGPLFNPYSFWGIIWVHIASSGLGLKVLLLIAVFGRLGAALEEAAWTAGANKFTTLWRITIPVLSPMIVAITVLTLIRGLQSFNTELLLGTPVGIYVYSTRIYDYIRQEPPAFGEATALGSVFLGVLAVLLAVYWWYLSGKRKFTVVTGQGYSTQRVKLGKWKYIALGGWSLYFAFTLVLPLAFLVLGSFMRRYGFFNIRDPYTVAHWQNLFADPIFLVSLKNSLVICTATALGGILLYSTVAYLLVSRRKHAGAAMTLESLCWLPHVMPGILMGLGLLWLFLSTPLRTVLYGTVWGIALALIIGDSPLTTQAFRASLLQLGHELEEAARVAGARWRYTYRRIILPLLAPMAATMGLINFGSALTSISTPVLLYSAQSRPLSILLLEYSFAGELERGACLGILITLFMCGMVVVGRKLGLQLVRQQ